MKLMIVLATGLVLTTGVAWADEPYLPRSEKAVQKLDANKDGRVTPDEIKPRMLKRFAGFDANGDKAVTAQEFEALLQKRIEQRRVRYFALMDANKDGTITQAEFDRVADDMFDKADTDHDGGVNLAELKVFKRTQWRSAFLGKPVN